MEVVVVVINIVAVKVACIAVVVIPVISVAPPTVVVVSAVVETDAVLVTVVVAVCVADFDTKDLSISVVEAGELKPVVLIGSVMTTFVVVLSVSSLVVEVVEVKLNWSVPLYAVVEADSVAKVDIATSLLVGSSVARVVEEFEKPLTTAAPRP